MVNGHLRSTFDNTGTSTCSKQHLRYLKQIKEIEESHVVRILFTQSELPKTSKRILIRQKTEKGESLELQIDNNLLKKEMSIKVLVREKAPAYPMCRSSR